MTSTTITSESTKAKRPDATTHQWQADWVHEGSVFWTLPYQVSVEWAAVVQIMDRRYRLIAVLHIGRKPTDRQMKAISFIGEINMFRRDGERAVYGWNDGMPAAIRLGGLRKPTGETGEVARRKRIFWVVGQQPKRGSNHASLQSVDR